MGTECGVRERRCTCRAITTTVFAYNNLSRTNQGDNSWKTFIISYFISNINYKSINRLLSKKVILQGMIFTSVNFKIDSLINDYFHSTLIPKELWLRKRLAHIQGLNNFYQSYTILFSFSVRID